MVGVFYREPLSKTYFRCEACFQVCNLCVRMIPHWAVPCLVSNIPVGLMGRVIFAIY